jgi:hypothetical protein
VAISEKAPGPFVRVPRRFRLPDCHSPFAHRWPLSRRTRAWARSDTWVTPSLMSPVRIISGTAPGALRPGGRGVEFSRRAGQRLNWMDYYDSQGCSAALACRHFDIRRQTFYRRRRRYNRHYLSPWRIGHCSLAGNANLRPCPSWWRVCSGCGRNITVG